MRKLILTSVFFSILFGYTTAQDLLYNNSSITVQSGATLYVNGGIVNQTNGSFTNNGNIYVSGNITQSASNNFTASGSTGTLELNGTALQTFKGVGSGLLNFYKLTMNNTSGAQLNRNIMVTNNLTMTAGNINLNGNNIDLSSTGTLVNETNAKRIYGTSGVITTTRNINAPSSLNVGGMGAEITTSANLGSTQIDRGHAVQTVGGNNSILRYFDITPTNNTSLNATLRFHYFDANELNGLTESSLQMYRSTNGGTSWTYEGGTPAPVSDYVELSGISSFSRWTLSDVGLLLPISLLDFQAHPDANDQVILNWSTSTETNSDYFEIQRSADGQEFFRVADHDAVGFTNGITQYDDIDMHPFSGISYYRLKMFNTDATYTYSAVRKVNIEKALAQVTLWPNPASVFASIYLRTNLDKSYQWLLFNITGQLVQTETYSSSLVTIPLQGLSAGLYHWSITSENAQVFKGKLILVK